VIGADDLTLVVAEVVRAAMADGEPTASDTFVAVATAQTILERLAHPAHRDALVAGLVEAGVLSHAGVWERPEVDVDALEKAKARYREGNDERLAAEAAGKPWTDVQWEALMAETAPFFDGRRIQNGPRLYFEGEEYPPGAVALFRIGGDHA
jgi:hypothetical protein